MLKFNWSVIPSKYSGAPKMIRWNCEWDGKFDNDPLLSDDNSENMEHFTNPFSQTIDYKEDLRLFKRVGVDTEGDPRKKFLHSGEIVADNFVTRGLISAIELSIKNPETFRGISGNTHAYCYRSQLLGFLCDLWD